MLYLFRLARLSTLGLEWWSASQSVSQSAFVASKNFVTIYVDLFMIAL